jgi:glycosyltransferase involved in cell wall biosynthesis
MKILYDHQMFSLQKYGGITKYFCELIKNMPKGYEYKLSLLFSDNQHLKDAQKIFRKLHISIPQKESRVRGHLKAKSYKLNNIYSKCIIRSGNYDLLHPTYFDPYFMDVVKKPYIVTVHDLIAFKYKNVSQREEQMARMTQIINNSRRIIAISENTKKDLIEFLNVNPEKIDVIYHGFNRVNHTNLENPYGRYILYVGARLGYKNFTTFARAFSKILLHDRDLKLICVGPPFTINEAEDLKLLKIFENTISMGVNETELNQLYSHALAFVYPTIYEGFGMPILESFANNCPVCLSNSSCLPEIAGDAGVYFEPTNSDSISEAIIKTIYDPVFTKELIDKGNQRLDEFSWKKCAQQTVQSYEKALS